MVSIIILVALLGVVATHLLAIGIVAFAFGVIASVVYLLVYKLISYLFGEFTFFSVSTSIVFCVVIYVIIYFIFKAVLYSVRGYLYNRSLKKMRLYKPLASIRKMHDKHLTWETRDKYRRRRMWHGDSVNNRDYHRMRESKCLEEIINADDFTQKRLSVLRRLHLNFLNSLVNNTPDPNVSCGKRRNDATYEQTFNYGEQFRIFLRRIQNLDLNGWELQGAEFLSSILQNADFRNATLILADFGWTDLEGANFSNTDCRGAYFYNTKFLQTNFQGANLEKAEIIHLTRKEFLKMVTVDERTNLTDVKFNEE